ncbi:hypothetical protein TWF694_001604 [Orbilia ellipsospora]|uniref:Uncharacterized protein n=1 Tax=Orbilia ellipsospora TaxID=2528407 RepID=A0AAV9X308_9PEZI
MTALRKPFSTAVQRPVLQTRWMHKSGALLHPSILSSGPSHSRNQTLPEPSSHPNVYSSRPPLHAMKKFTPMQLTCNFQTTPPKPDAPLLLVMPRLVEPDAENTISIPYINILTRNRVTSKVLISTSHGDTAHITSPSGLASTVGNTLSG